MSLYALYRENMLKIHFFREGEGGEIPPLYTPLKAYLTGPGWRGAETPGVLPVVVAVAPLTDQNS